MRNKARARAVLTPKVMAMTTTTGPGGTDMIRLLVDDHRDVKEMFLELESVDVDAERRHALTGVLIAELVRHAVAEEQHLYPIARWALDDGEVIADREIAQHAEAEQTMKRLEGLNVTDADHQDNVRQLIDNVRQHVERTEAELFPRLRQECPYEQLVELGDRIAATKEAAPTRPHPSLLPSSPAGALLTSGVSVVDKIRDAVGHRPTNAEDLR